MTDLPVPPIGKFYDLNIPFNGDYSKLGKILEMAEKMGLHVICLNKTLMSNTDTKSKKKSNNEVTAIDVSKIKEYFPELSKNFYFLTGVTIELREPNDQYRVRDVLQANSFDIFCVRPYTEKMFHCACTEMNIDLITFDMSEKLPFYLKKNPVNAAIQRDVYFEICYSPMIGDTTVRRLAIGNALRLVECCKGKNIVISSKAKNEMDIRSPYDAMNIGHLIGLPKNVLRHTVSENCRKVAVHGFSRKTAKCAIFIQKISATSNEPDSKKTKLE